MTLASFAAARLNRTTVDDHPFTFRVEPHTMGHYRWTIEQGGWTRDVSSEPYATKREAEADANKAMLKLIAHWRKSK